MKKEDLKVGMVVQTRNGESYMVMPRKSDGLILVNNDGWIGLSQYNYNLKVLGHSQFDIISVYGFVGYYMDALNITINSRPLLWKREEVKKMTVEELEKELGYKIEIVSDH